MLVALVAGPALAYRVAAASPAPTVAATERGTAPAIGTTVSTNLPPTKVIPPEPVNLPRELAEVARLTESGVDQNVVLLYVQQSAKGYPVSADQLIYLRDLGVSEPVLQALVEHSSTPTAPVLPGTAAAPTPAGEGQAPSPAVPSETQPPAESPASSESTAPPPVSGAAASFYDSLAPYGTWLYLPAYGWCWQPTVAVANSSWLPYGDEGYWLWSDNGWYWNSYYSWGWAPFHYGRWCRYPRYGWVWCPDHVWGSAWVCWRDWGDYCGWAPLPPGACFSAGLGWSFGGVGVGFDFGFGLPWSCFSFVPYRHFCDRDWHEHHLVGHEAERAFDHSRPSNRYLVDSHHPFINRGVDPGRVRAATHRPLQTVAIREMPRAGANAAMPGHLVTTGRKAIVYRPRANFSGQFKPALGGLNTPRALPKPAPSGRTGSSMTSPLKPLGEPSREPFPPANRYESRASGWDRVTQSQPPMRSSPTAPAARAPARSEISGSVPPRYAWRATPSWSVPERAYSAPSSSYRSAPAGSFSGTARSVLPGRSFSPPAFRSSSFASRPAPAWHAASPSSGAYGHWGGGGQRYSRR